MKGNLIKVALGFIFVLTLTGAYAQEKSVEQPANSETKEKITVTTKEVEGQVTGLSHNFIAVLYGNSAETGSGLEMGFRIDQKKVRIEHKKDLSEIGMGDIVKISYEETIKTEDNTREISNRQPKVITFLRQAEKKPETRGTLQSKEKEVEDEAIPIKGLKGD